MPLISKLTGDLNADTSSRLVGLGYTDAAYAGTGARNILEAITFKLSDVTATMAANLDQAYVSKANGANLDALGLLVGVPRRSSEIDQNYRVRITQSATSRDVSTLSSLLSALLTLSNVRNVIVRPFTQGPGSLSFYLIPIQAPITQDTITAAQVALGSLVAGGCTTSVLVPTTKYLNLVAITSIDTATANPNGSRSLVSQTVSKYIANLSMGTPFIVAEATAAAINADPSILDFNLITISTTDVNGVTMEQLPRNFTPAFDEELQPGQILIT
jgi:hypothetical protein